MYEHTIEKNQNSWIHKRIILDFEIAMHQAVFEIFIAITRFRLGIFLRSS